MINKYQYIWQVLLLYVLLLISGIFIIRNSDINLQETTYSTLLSAMTIITLGVYLLVKIASRKEEKERVIILLFALGGKFLAYLIMILIFWLRAKNLDTEFIIAFFILYLLLTFSLIRALYKVLKNN